MYRGIQHSLWSNRFKSLLFLIFLPVLLFIVVVLIFWYLNKGGLDSAVESALGSFVYIGPVVLVWALISFFFHRQMIFKFSGAKPVTRKENPQIYNIVENLCISRGLRTPNIGIIEDQSMNAFATGWNTKHARIVFSRGLIDNLEEKEIQAVAAHELTHVMNNDSLLMIIVVIYIGIITTLGEVILRIGIHSDGGGKNSKGKLFFLLLGVALLILGYLVYPFIQMAVSRKREYLADAGSVVLTKDKDAMISALEKISGNSIIESIDKRGVGAMCIENPFQEKRKNKGFFKSFKYMFSTHPSIEDRVKALQNY